MWRICELCGKPIFPTATTHDCSDPTMKREHSSAVDEYRKTAEVAGFSHLSVRAWNCLSSVGVFSMVQLENLTEIDLFRIAGCGRLTVRHILKERAKFFAACAATPSPPGPPDHSGESSPSDHPRE